MINKDRFNFCIDFDIDKAAKKDNENKYDNMIFYGMASDNSKDTESEVLEPSGYDLSYFMKNGLFNLEHFTKRKGDAKFWIGEPLESEIKNNKFFVKGRLWKDSELARNLWDTINIMKNSNSTRKPGMSIEGRALERDPKNPKRITKAIITNIAITMTPVNSNSWLEIVKGVQKNDYVETEPVIETQNNILTEFDFKGKTFYVMRDFSIVEKTLTTKDVAPLTKESLDREVKDYLSNAVNKGILDKKKILQNIINNC